ncbi:MAG: 2-amino-4-hydroxy-6-hydroxymethyldihydropteridine diphosphokinase [Candidatus Scalinduaceae bacterium]
MAKVYVGLGSNLGNREKNLVSAITKINACKGIHVVNKSGFYKTKPIGGPAQPDYVNCVLELDTDITPQKLLEKCKRIESELGRTRGVRWGPRVIDIDILLYGSKVVNDHNLKIPHENMHTRIFVLEPLYEISPDLKHPILKKTIFELMKELKVSIKN